jgi:type I restriction enzyme R subunit
LLQTTEAFSRVKIDAQLGDVGWTLEDGISVHFEYTLSDGTKADYVLCDRTGRPLAIIEAKRQSTMPTQARAQAQHYAKLLDVPYVFLSNGDEIWFWEWQREAHPRQIKTLFSQADLERRAAMLILRKDPFDVPVDKRVAGRDYQIECVDTLTREMSLGRRKLLVEMATGTGKTRMAAAFIKRLFDANQITRVLFLADRIALAKQTEDAFTEHMPELPCYVLRAGRKFQHEKRVTITTLQTMINEYARFSSGYFDLIITDEYHRSIYGRWSGALRHFDGLQLGLTATPCVIRDADNLPDPEDGLFVRDTRSGSSKWISQPTATPSETRSTTATSCLIRSTQRRRTDGCPCLPYRRHPPCPAPTEQGAPTAHPFNFRRLKAASFRKAALNHNPTHFKILNVHRT